MRSHIVQKDNSNMKAEKFISTMHPKLSYSTLQKAFRKRDIKVNGKRIGRNYMVKTGDVVEIYITDEHLLGSVKSIITKSQMGFTVVYEDENLLLVNKKQGIPVHPDKDQVQNTLIDQVRDYLKQNRIKTERTEEFQPLLCHRLDRNTGGLTIIAKNHISHDTLLEKIEKGEIRKFYKCLVLGCPEREEALLKAHLWKDASKSKVFISHQKTTGAVNITTKYRVLKYDPTNDISLLEVELITGRTHQIRAHMAFMGHPVLGDGKYGINSVNRKFGIKMQALWAYKLFFDFKDQSALDYLSQREFTVVPDFDIKRIDSLQQKFIL